MDEAHDNLYRYLRDEGHEANEISERILKDIDLIKVFRRAAESWDGGYALIGAIGNGDNFALRDPLGIRPLFYFEDDEVFAAASERAPLMTIFNKKIEDIEEVSPGHIVVVKKSGRSFASNSSNRPKNELNVHSSGFTSPVGMTRTSTRNAKP